MTDRLINSAALYFGPEAPQSVPILWLTRAIGFFESRNITLDYFYVAGTEAFSQDGTYDFRDYKYYLFKAVNERVENIGLYSNPNPQAPRSAWRAMASFEMHDGMTFLGIDEAMFPEHGSLLRSAYLMGGELLGVTYGISYKQLLSDGPDCYATGVHCASLADIRRLVTSPDESDRRLTAWRNEMWGSRRYLAGMFRGAYPASIISCEHLAALRERARSGKVPGTITPFVDNKLWLWELTGSQMIAAERLLQGCSLLVE
jgi:hypothetical protein